MKHRKGTLPTSEERWAQAAEDARPPRPRRGLLALILSLFR